MKPYRRPMNRGRTPSQFQAWAGAMLALAPLSVLLWVVDTTGMGIA